MGFSDHDSRHSHETVDEPDFSTVHDPEDGGRDVWKMAAGRFWKMAAGRFWKMAAECAWKMRAGLCRCKCAARHARAATTETMAFMSTMQIKTEKW